MSDTSFDKEQENVQNTDNMAQQQADMEDAIAHELNVDDSVSGMQHLDEEVADNEDTGQIQKQLDEAKDKYIRLVAEFDNFRKRSAREYADMRQTAGKDIVQSLLVVLDDCERAEKQMEKATDAETLKEGVSLVFNKLKAILQQKGLKAMDAINQPFDADIHEAITEIPAPVKI